MSRTSPLLASLLVACTTPSPLFDDGGPGADAAAMDAGLEAPRDAGVNDAGVTDAGPDDAGVNDAGVNDAGVNDAGPGDAGPCPTGFDECDGDPAVRCETDLSDDATCGSCDNVCSLSRSCVSGACEPMGVTSLALGDEHTCALLADARVVCWGRDHRGQLGDGFTPESAADDRPTPDLVVDLPLSAHVSAGGSATCAIAASDGAVRCWGHNNPERFGDGSHSGSQPRPIDLTWTGAPAAVLEVDQTRSHLCVRTRDDVLCAGRNFFHQLGRESGTTAILASVEGLPFARRPRSIATGYSATQGFTLVALDDGSVWCFGANGDSQCAQPSSGEVGVPTMIVGLTNIVQVDAGENFACALDDVGAVFCWGTRQSGRQGDGMTSGVVATPTQVVGIPAMRRLALTDSSALAETADGTGVWAWGSNSRNGLGLGPAMTGVVATPVPAIVDSGAEFSAWTSGAHSCLVRRQSGAPDEVLCAGDNDYFQLGMDPAPDSSRFTSIATFP